MMAMGFISPTKTKKFVSDKKEEIVEFVGLQLRIQISSKFIQGKIEYTLHCNFRLSGKDTVAQGNVVQESCCRYGANGLVSA